jgi:hypothetical protein
MCLPCLQAGLVLDDLCLSSEKTTKSIAVWFWVSHHGRLVLKNGTFLEHGGYVYMLEDIEGWILIGDVSQGFIDKKR